MSKLTKYIISSLIFCISGAIYAGSLGDVAENLLAPTELVTKVVLIVCYIVGFALLLTALAQYKIHRQSPKLVPLTTPITLAVLGVIALLLPYGSKLFNEEGQQNERPKRTTTLPLPNTKSNRGAVLPLPGEGSGAGGSDNTSPAAAPPPASSPSEAPKPGSHWTDEPRYN